MTHRHEVLRGVACGAALALVGLSASAAAPARLSYHAPPGCPDERDFVAAVRARGASLEATGATGAANAGERGLEVTLEQDASGFSGALQLRDGEQTSERRQVRAASCAEVSDALAVVTAIALAADASPVTAASSASTGATSSASTGATPAVATAARERSVHLLGMSDSVDVPAGKLQFEQVRRYTLTAGAALGLIPDLTLPRFDFTILASSLLKTPGDADYITGGGLRVRWSFLGVGTHRSPGFATRIWGLKAGFGGCGPLSYDPQGLIVSVCSEIAAGVMALETKDAAGSITQKKTVGIGTAGVELGSQYQLGSLFHVDLRAGVEMWLSRLTAERPDGSRLFQSSNYNAYVVAGLGLQF